MDFNNFMKFNGLPRYLMQFALGSGGGAASEKSWNPRERLTTSTSQYSPIF